MKLKKKVYNKIALIIFLTVLLISFCTIIISSISYEKNLINSSITISRFLSVEILKNYQLYYNSGFKGLVRKLDYLAYEFTNLNEFILVNMNGEILLSYSEIKDGQKSLKKDRKFDDISLLHSLTPGYKRQLNKLQYLVYFPILDLYSTHQYSIIYYLSYKPILMQIFQASSGSLILLILMLIVSYFISRSLSEQIVAPIDNLSKSVINARLSSYSLSIAESNIDEFFTLERNLNELMKIIKNETNLLTSTINSINSVIIAVNNNFNVTLCNKNALFLFKMINSNTDNKNIDDNIDNINNELENCEGKNIFNIYPFLKKISSEMEDTLNKGNLNKFDIIVFDEFPDKYFSIYILPLKGWENIEETSSKNKIDHIPLNDYNDNSVKTQDKKEIESLKNTEGRGLVLRIDDITTNVKLQKNLEMIEKNEIVGSFAAGIIHDFNNLISGIKETTALISSSIKLSNKELDQDLKENLDIINEISAKALVTLQHLLSLSKNYELKKDKINLYNVIERVVKFSASSLDQSVRIIFENKLEFKKGESIKQFSTIGDEYALEQVLLNIIINANHSMTIMRDDKTRWGGNIHISIDETSEVSKYYVDKQKKFWRISIKDEGVGVPPELKRKIFDPFFTTKASQNGTGLGLSTSLKIIQMHDGFIDLDSRVGEGTCFYIYIPSTEG
ncbi:MAG TPA: ATP-binding protein [Exilispira sp.]|nr:ATP-binding protein [Exilispira sp.]